MAGLKMTGAEYKAFTAAPWGPGWYWDETDFLHNNVEKDDIGEVEDTDTIVILSGTIYKGDTPRAEAIDAVAYARKWLKAQAFTSVIVEVPNDQVTAFKADMKSKGLKVVA